MSMFRSDERAEVQQLYDELPPSSLPFQYFLSTAFPETPLSYCCPLPAPFDHYAITQLGVVFRWKPLELIRGPWGWTIHPQVCLPIQEDDHYRGIVELQCGLGASTQFFVDRLVLNRFYNVDLYEPVYIFYLDNDRMNLSYHNLTAIYPQYLEIARRYCVEDIDDIEYRVKQSLLSKTALVRGEDYQGNPDLC